MDLTFISAIGYPRFMDLNSVVLSANPRLMDLTFISAIGYPRFMDLNSVVLSAIPG